MKHLTPLRFTALLSALALAGPLHAATLQVTTGADSGAGSLRQALVDAAAGDVITFSGVTDVKLDSQLDFTKNLSINGPSVTLDGQLKGRVLHVAAGASVTLQGLIITRGLLAGKGIDWNGTAESGSSWGAGIRNDGTLVLDGVQVVGNYATGGGGGAAEWSHGGGGGGSGVRVTVGGSYHYGRGGNGGNGWYLGGSASDLAAPAGGQGYAAGGSGSNGGGAGGGAGTGDIQFPRGGGGGAGGWAGGGGAGGGGGGFTASAGGGGFGGGAGDYKSAGGGSNGSSGGASGVPPGGGGAGGSGSAAGNGSPNYSSGGGGGGYAGLGGVWVGGGGGAGGARTDGIDGGSAAGGIYNASGAVLTVQGSGCQVTANLAAGGGTGATANGGQAVGGVWNDGTLLTIGACATFSFGNKAGGGGHGGVHGYADAHDDLRGPSLSVQPLSVSVIGAGSVSADGVPAPASGGINTCTSAGGAACTAAYAQTTPAGSVILTASAGPDQPFAVQWGGACSGTASTCTVTMDQARSVTATFTLLYPITTSASPTAGGTVTCTPNPVSHGSTSTCSASASPGYTFTGWSGDCSGSGACSLTNVTAAKSVTASFVPVITSFSGTTVPPSGAGGSATAQFTGGGPACRFDVASTAFIAAPAAPPPGQLLPQGMFQFKLIGCDNTAVNMSITWPKPVSGLTKWGAASAGAAPSYFAPDGLSVGDHTSSFTVIDGQKGDDDWAVNGTIVDPVGPTASAAVAPIPTLGQWGLMLLGLLAAGLGLSGLRRRGV